ncbi:MAG: hypothetical protein DRH76_02000 [Deltaproteobacteria bacterium]|nr:MAG: hypothetical protein DRH76_02000 [Deltaproteobacteria bacterium]
MKRTTATIACVGFLMTVLAAVPRADASSVHAAPISLVNPSPTQLLFLQAPPDRAQTLPRGAGRLTVSNSLTNTLLVEEGGPATGIIDMEMLRTTVDFNYGLSDRFELNLSMPLAMSGSGILNHMILDVEQAFGNARKVREEESPGQYHFDIRRGGRRIIGSDDRATGPGDLAVRLKALLLHEGESTPALATRLGLKLPTGRRSRSLGSGGTDVGLGLLLEKHFGPVAAFLNADVIFPGSIDDPEVDTKTFYQAMFGLSYPFNDAWSAGAQVAYTSRPFSGTGLTMLDRRIVDLLLGVTYQRPGGFFVQAGTMEDIIDSVDAGADITFFLNLGWHF